MSIIVFVLLGLIAGDVARGLFKSTGIKGVVLDLGLGVAGAVIFGSLFSHIASTGAAGLNTATALVAALGGPLRCSLHFTDCATRAIGGVIRSDRSSKIPCFKLAGVAFMSPSAVGGVTSVTNEMQLK